jgi:DNA-binding NarL/FixJ family response regulator
VPTSIELSVALQALSFIKSGGQFFPPSVLSRAHSPWPVPFKKTAALGESVNGANGWSHELNGCTEGLTAKQAEVIRLLRQGETNKLIARRLGLSEATVKVHVRQIMRKLGVKNRTQVAISALNDGDA